MTDYEIIAYSSFIVWVGFALVGFLVSRLLKRYDVVDFLWGLLFVALAWTMSTWFGTISFKSNLILFLMTLWALRLSTYMAIRISQGPEDRRYTAWRQDWGRREGLYSFLQVFALQPLFAVIIFLPIALQLSLDNTILSWRDVVGSLIFIIGFFMETVADGQLYLFKKSTKHHHQVMNKGLWAYSQHPNYFGEWLIWLGLAFICYDAVGLWALSMPVIMLYVLFELTGIRMKQRFIKDYSGYAEYVKQTPLFFPLTAHQLLIYFWACVIVLALDFVWLGFIAGDFYWQHYEYIARVKDGTYDVVVWAALLVYLLIPAGVTIFALDDNFWSSVWRGFCFGLISYGIYDYTAMSLLMHWSIESVIVDVMWGGFLCSISAATLTNVDQFFKRNRQLKA